MISPFSARSRATKNLAYCAGVKDFSLSETFSTRTSYLKLGLLVCMLPRLFVCRLETMSYSYIKALRQFIPGFGYFLLITKNLKERIRE